MEKQAHLTLMDVRPLKCIDNYTPIKEPWYVELKDNICFFFWDIHCNINGFIQGCKNVLRFTKHVWYLRHWDFETILPLIEEFLKYVRNGIVEDKLVQEAQTIASEIQKTLSDLHKYRNAHEIYEEENQDMLRAILEAKTERKKDSLEKKYLTKMYEFENDKWCDFWGDIMINSQGWWD